MYKYRTKILMADDNVDLISIITMKLQTVSDPEVALEFGKHSGRNKKQEAQKCVLFAIKMEIIRKVIKDIMCLSYNIGK